MKTITPTNYCIMRAQSKNISMDKVRQVLAHPSRITQVSRYPGQLRYIGLGIAVIVDGDIAITVYLDGVITPLRPDQIARGERIMRTQ